ncbi:MAG: transglycosylase SLT domain-containing protein [Pseudomonadota bacterium]
MRPSLARLLPAAALAAALFSALSVLPASTDAATTPQQHKTKDFCAAAVSAQERSNRIPSRLLTAISLVESGRWDPETRSGRAWPWTVTAQGKGRFFPSKSAAIAAVKRLQKRGITSIDVGCMQVNLHFHPEAFATLDEAFEPRSNAAYAASFLVSLKKGHGSWRRAVQHYHSSTPEKRIPYQKKVYAKWRGRDATPAPIRTASEKRRLKNRIERDHRAKLRDYRRGQRQATAKKAPAHTDAAPDTRAPRFLSSWPPRDARAQMRAQTLARSWAFGGGTAPKR